MTTHASLFTLFAICFDLLMLYCQYCLQVLALLNNNILSISPATNKRQGPVVRKAVSTNPGLKVKLGFDFSCEKAYLG